MQKFSQVHSHESLNELRVFNYLVKTYFSFLYASLLENDHSLKFPDFYYQIYFFILYEKYLGCVQINVISYRYYFKK